MDGCVMNEALKKEVLSNIDVDESIELHQQMIRIKSVRGEEKEIAEFLTTDVELSKAEGEYATLRGKIQDAEYTEEKMVSLQNEIQTTEEEFHRLMPETCPLCGQEIE